MPRRLFFALAFTLLLQACGLPFTRADMEQKPETRFVRGLMEQLGRHDFEALEAAADPSLDRSTLRPGLEQMAQALPAGAVKRSEAVGWYVQSKVSFGAEGQGSRFVDVVIEYEFEPNQTILVMAKLSGEPDQLRVLGFHLNPLPAPLGQINALTLAGKGPLHALFIALALTSLSTCLYAFVRCLRSKGLRRKWLWALFTLTGCGMVALDWTSGEINVQPLFVSLFCAGLVRSGPVAPWVLSFSLPVGALIFLWRQRAAAIDLANAAAMPSPPVGPAGD